MNPNSPLPSAVSDCCGAKYALCSEHEDDIFDILVCQKCNNKCNVAPPSNDSGEKPEEKCCDCENGVKIVLSGRIRKHIPCFCPCHKPPKPEEKRKWQPLPSKEDDELFQSFSTPKPEGKADDITNLLRSLADYFLGKNDGYTECCNEIAAHIFAQDQKLKAYEADYDLMKEMLSHVENFGYGDEEIKMVKAALSSLQIK